MRQIQKRNEPVRFTEWRAANQADCNYGYALIDADLRQEVKQSLVSEQRGLCAYTGRRITEVSCHIEHPKPQVHCVNGEDVSYGNMVACVPAPNAPFLPYGANKKGSWPNDAQQAQFVSPLGPNCATRFSFNLLGEVAPTNAQDAAAQQTITNLALDHPQLTQLRKAAIDSTLAIRGRGPAALDAKRARQRAASLMAVEQGNGTLEPFCFVLLQVLEKHIRRLAAIRRSHRVTP